MRLIFLLLTAMAFFFSAGYSQQHYLLLGTYTSGSSYGIYAYRFNSQTADATVVDSIKSSNPSFLTIVNNKFIYSVNEDRPGHVSAYRFDTKTAKLQLLNQLPVSGDHPCYITATQNGKWIIVGNYTSGNIAVFSTNEDGTLRELHQMIQHQGSGPNSSRQQSPHVHAAVFTNTEKIVMVPDLGTDKLMLYAFDKESGKLSPYSTPFIQTAGGTGPRHIEIHPNQQWAYLVLELTGEIQQILMNKKELFSKGIQVTAQEKNYSGTVSGADIHISPNGKFLYSSNRGESNTIAVFSIHPKNGTLTLLQHQSTLGKTPRNFNFDPTRKFLLVANQNSNLITIFNYNTKTGMLKDSGKRIVAPNPVCIKWITDK